MKVTFPAALMLMIGLIVTACTDNGTALNTEMASADANANANANTSEAEMMPIDEYWAKDNFDMARLGSLLERAESPEHFERLLNDEGGVNNLDLNGDGYVDYVSVDEFGERTDRERGLSFYTRYDDDSVQELGSLVFYRDEPTSPGARVLLRGDEHLFGPNHFYETDWVDRALDIVSFLFSPRDSYYQSPYYYDNYPADYALYEVIEQPVYVSRMQRLYPEPVFVFTESPQVLSYVTIESPYEGRWIENIYARAVDPTPQQMAWIRDNPMRARYGYVPDGPGRSEEAASRTGVPPGRPDSPGKSESAPGRTGDTPGRSGGAPAAKGGDLRGGNAPGRKELDRGKPAREGRKAKPGAGGNNGKGGGKPEVAPGRGQGQGKGGKP